MQEPISLHDAVLKGDAATARKATQAALAAGADAVKIVSDYMVPAMDEVGRRFEDGGYFVPQAARAGIAS